MSGISYSNAVGSLMYAMICTRLDISHAVSIVSRYMSNLDKEYWQVVKWIFRYLRDTSDVCLEFGRHDSSMVGFIDSDFARDLDRRRSIISYVFFIGGCTISWKAFLQPIVALSTTEIKYIVVIEVIKEAIWLKDLFCKLSLVHNITVVHCDS